MMRLPAFALFFPAAGAWAFAMAALKACEANACDEAALPILPAGWHGHEMLFGYAYAVVGGYLLTRPDPIQVVAAFAAWTAGRAVLFLPGPSVFTEAAVALIFPVLLFALAGLPLARKAKKARNRVFAPLLGALAAAETIYQLGAVGGLSDGLKPGLLLAADGILLLLFIMGGRILATVSSGAHQARGRALTRLVQPRLEGWGALCLGTMALADPLGLAGWVGGTLALAGAGICGARLKGWQGWRLRDDPGLIALNLGYAWLAIGLAVKGIAQWTGAVPVFEALHVALIGGLGTLSVTVMTRVVGQRVRRTGRLPAVTTVAVGFISVAALTRMGAWLGPERTAWLIASAGAWCLAMALFLVGLATRKGQGPAMARQKAKGPPSGPGSGSDGTWA